MSLIEQSMHDQSRVMGQALLFSLPPLYVALVCTAQVGTPHDPTFQAEG